MKRESRNLKQPSIKKINNLLPHIFFKESKKSALELISDLSEPDKKYFKKLILWNKLSPVLLNNFSTNQLNLNFSEESVQEFKKQRDRLRIHSLSLIHQVREINFLLTNNNLLGVFLKGVPLAFFEYPDISIRPMLDIDLLMHEKDIYILYDQLLQNGYAHEKNITYDKKSLAEFINISHQLPQLYKNNISLELHHRVTDKKIFEICPLKDSILKRNKTKNFMNFSIHVPHEEDMLLHQITKLYSYPEFKLGLLSLFDFLTLEKNYNFDLINLVNSIKNKKLRKNTILTLSLFSLILPSSHKLMEVRNKFFNQNDEPILRFSFKRIYELPSSSFLHNSYSFYLIQNKNLRGFLSLFIRKIFPSKARIKYKYGEKAANKNYIFMFYIINFFILLNRYKRDLIVLSIAFLKKNPELENYKSLSEFIRSDK